MKLLNLRRLKWLTVEIARGWNGTQLKVWTVESANGWKCERLKVWTVESVTGWNCSGWNWSGWNTIGRNVLTPLKTGKVQHFKNLFVFARIWFHFPSRTRNWCVPPKRLGCALEIFDAIVVYSLSYIRLLITLVRRGFFRFTILWVSDSALAFQVRVLKSVTWVCQKQELHLVFPESLNFLVFRNEQLYTTILLIFHAGSCYRPAELNRL